MQTSFTLPIAIALVACAGAIGSGPVTIPMQDSNTPAAAASFFDLHANDIHGHDMTMGQWKGKKILVVNVASECGNTPQYAQLQGLWEEYKDKGLVIVGFPCDQFGGQEPGDEAHIEAFCKKNYGVTFPLMSKVEVKGEHKHPVYQWLTEKRFNGKMDVDVRWNFQKFLVNENGSLATTVAPGTDPTDDAIMSWINGKP